MNKWQEETEKESKSSILLMIAEMKLFYDVIRSSYKKIASKWSEAAPEANVVQWFTPAKQRRLQNQVSALKPEYIKVDNFIKNRLPLEYNTQYYREAYNTVQLFRQNKYDIRVPAWLKTQMDQMLSNPTSKYNIIGAIANDRNISIQRAYRVISDGIMQGKSLQNINKDIDIELGYRDRATGKLFRKPTNYKGDFYKRMRVLRTELISARGQAATDEWIRQNNAGLESSLVLVATLDNRTRPQSAQMDGQKAREDGKFRYPDGNYYTKGTQPAKWRINDRETTIQLLPDDDIKNFARTMKLKEKNKTEPYQSFFEYAKSEGMTRNKYGQLLFPEAKK